jgi:hypothetical protein
VNVANVNSALHPPAWLGRLADRRWHFDQPYPAAAPVAPSSGRKPCLGRCHGARLPGARSGCCPTVEPRCRRAPIDAGRTANVLLPVLEHVEKRGAGFGGSAEMPGMVPVAPDAASAPCDLVDGTSQANRQAPSAQTQTTMVGRFDDAVYVVVLHGKLDDAKACARACRECGSNRIEDTRASQGSKAAGGAQRDVDRKAVDMSRASTMRYGGASPWYRGASGAIACAAPA